jgi:hypothetical protein
VHSSGDKFPSSTETRIRDEGITDILKSTELKDDQELDIERNEPGKMKESPSLELKDSFTGVESSKKSEKILPLPDKLRLTYSEEQVLTGNPITETQAKSLGYEKK